MSIISFPLALTLSALVSAHTSRVDVPTTPRECVEEVKAFRMAEIFARGYFDAPYIPKDTIEMKVSVKAKGCIEKFAGQTITGKQVDALAQLAVLATNDQQGRDLFTKRLAEPDISLREKALANLAAVIAFADAEKPARVAIAEEYTKALDALPVEEGGEQAAYAHMTLANVYRLTGQTDQQVEHGLNALRTARKGTRQERASLVKLMIATYGDLAEAYITMPEGRNKIDAATEIMIRPLNTSDDPMVVDGLEKAVRRAGMLGRVAPSVQANHWFNRESPPNGTLDLKGTVPHLVEFTQFSCGPCRGSYPGLTRLQKRFKETLVIVMSTNTQGGWGSKGVVDGEFEAEQLKNYYVNQHKLSFPIALWEGKKHPTEDGGLIPEKNPTWDSYGVWSFPQIVLVDTKGIIRQVLPSFTRDDEERVATKIRQLLQEAGINEKSTQ